MAYVPDPANRPHRGSLRRGGGYYAQSRWGGAYPHAGLGLVLLILLLLLLFLFGGGFSSFSHLRYWPMSLLLILLCVFILTWFAALPPPLWIILTILEAVSRW
jgi:hypothetical protein